MTSPVVHSQCLPIYFNIFNNKKYRVTWQLHQYIGRKCDFIMLTLFMCIYIDNEYNWWRHQPVNMAVRFLWHFCRLSISNVNFFVLTKCWLPMLLSKLPENYAVLEEWTKYVNFGVHGPLKKESKLTQSCFGYWSVSFNRAIFWSH